MVAKALSRAATRVNGAIALHCRCLDISKDAGSLVLCETCGRWFHEECVGVTIPPEPDDSDGEQAEGTSSENGEDGAAQDTFFFCRDCNKAQRDELLGRELLAGLLKECEARRRRYSNTAVRTVDVPEGNGTSVRRRPRLSGGRVRFEEADVGKERKESSVRDARCPVCMASKGGNWYRCTRCCRWAHAECEAPSPPTGQEQRGRFVCPTCGGEAPGLDNATKPKKPRLASVDAPLESNGSPSLERMNDPNDGVPSTAGNSAPNLSVH